MENIASWVAPIATTIAALMTASNLGARITGYGFIVFTVGSIAWAALGVATGQPNLLWQNVVLTGLNLFGVWRWLGRQARIEEGGRSAAAASEAIPGEPLFPVSLLTNGKVVGARGADLGISVDAMAGCSRGRIEYLVVSQGGVAGVGEIFRRVDWNHVSADRDQVRARLSAKEFDQLETLAKDDWPGR
jgi:hypothetical protein